MHLQEIHDENTEAEINVMPAMEDTLKRYQIQAGDILASLPVVDLVGVSWGDVDDPQKKDDFVSAVILLMARIEEVHGYDIWRREPHTDLEEAAQNVHRILSKKMTQKPLDGLNE